MQCYIRIAMIRKNYGNFSKLTSHENGVTCVNVPFLISNSDGLTITVCSVIKNRMRAEI